MNDISMRPSYLLDNAPEEAFSDTIGYAVPAHISMDNDRFNVIDENGDLLFEPDIRLKVVMLWENDTRIYYPPNTYKRGDPKPPACYSDNRITPSIGALEPQAKFCAKCPRAEWDQPMPSGAKVPACRSIYKVACLVAGGKGRVYLLSITPASRKAYGAYRRFLRVNQARPSQVVTELQYKEKAFIFEFAGWVNEKMNEAVTKVLATDEPREIVGAFDRPREYAAELEGPKSPPAPQREAIKPPRDFEEPPQPVQAREPIKSPPPVFGGEASPPSSTPSRGRGRPRKDVSAPSNAPPTPPSAPSAPPSAFVTESPKEPPEDIQAALDALFGS